MAKTTLKQVQHLIDQLSPLEQVRLLEYLTPRIVHNLEATHLEKRGKEVSDDAAWERLFQLGDELAAGDTPASETLTQAVLKMRR